MSGNPALLKRIYDVYEVPEAIKMLTDLAGELPERLRVHEEAKFMAGKVSQRLKDIETELFGISEGKNEAERKAHSVFLKGESPNYQETLSMLNDLEGKEVDALVRLESSRRLWQATQARLEFAGRVISYFSGGDSNSNGTGKNTGTE